MQFLSGNAPLGQGQGGSVAGPDRHIGPPYYLVNDTFTTDRAAGSVNGTDAEPGPGPGRRTVTDGNNKLSLSGGAASIATGGVGAGNPGLYYGSLARVAGLLFVAQIAPTTENIQIGWETNQSASIGHGWRFAGSSRTLQGIVNGSNLTLGTWAQNAQNVAVVARISGFYFFLKPNGGQWTLMWISTAGNQTPLLPAFIAESATAVATSDYIRVPSTLWLPIPLASDGFSAWGTSDGLAHAEGVAGGLGSGGSGEAWTDNVGTWGASAGSAAASALSGGVAAATVDTGKADVLATVKVTRSGGVGGGVVRYADTDNYVYFVHNGTNAQLVKVVAGTPTTLVNVAATYVAGAEIRCICEGTAFRLYYNNAFIGSQQTISDAGLQSGTKQGLYTTDTGNTFDDLTIFARGSGGEYAALDAF